MAIPENYGIPPAAMYRKLITTIDDAPIYAPPRMAIVCPMHIRETNNFIYRLADAMTTFGWTPLLPITRVNAYKNSIMQYYMRIGRTNSDEADRINSVIDSMDIAQMNANIASSDMVYIVDLVNDLEGSPTPISYADKNVRSLDMFNISATDDLDARRPHITVQFYIEDIVGFSIEKMELIKEASKDHWAEIKTTQEHLAKIKEIIQQISDKTIGDLKDHKPPTATDITKEHMIQRMMRHNGEHLKRDIINTIHELTSPNRFNKDEDD